MPVEEPLRPSKQISLKASEDAKRLAAEVSAEGACRSNLGGRQARGRVPGYIRQGTRGTSRGTCCSTSDRHLASH